ncbi:uncharacterized protein DUF4374 [Arcticibacter pallidicorallinus]|uniref:Uncharacterized protein DUF4374 n=1 Tax=Arcticibacter pallidicorallinus TaxID=1259464 RepID=A0A2T0U8U1_9SPHI|nr:DUF4374 domain-containing protein [Arcticibacter pallidicorallinus]PRY54350.1 uncharacterized protein DUF4374 [Arcticibacter pallidicorallinus]
MLVRQIFKACLLAVVAFAAVSCSKDGDTDNNPDVGDKVYAIGIGVTVGSETTNYVVQTSDLMNGKISPLGNGLLQEGYRDYAFAGGVFYSIGGLGVVNVDAITLDAESKLTAKKGLTLELPNSQLVDVDGKGKTLVGVSLPASPTEGLNAKFYTLDIASNTVANKKDVPMNSIHPSAEDWLFHTGMQVVGSQLFQTFYPVDYGTYNTKNTDKNYLAVYSYPGFELQKVITDPRTGPSGAFNTMSGLFKTESGDLYAVSTSSIYNGYSQATKPAGILKIANGTSEFDANYFFNTDAAPNGGKIAHAIYIGGNKLFAAITTVPPSKPVVAAEKWSDANLTLAIVDLSAKTITRVANAPVYKGDGGRSFAALLDNGKVYSAIGVNGVVNIYETDIATATAKKGAVIEGTFMGGIARLK